MPAGDRADTLCALQDRLLLSDVSVTHRCADTYVKTAATTAGSVAEVHAAKKVAKYALREPSGYDFTSLVVESYGRRCCATHTLLNTLGRLAAYGGRVTKGAWVEGALRRLRVALCKGTTSCPGPTCMPSSGPQVNIPQEGARCLTPLN